MLFFRNYNKKGHHISIGLASKNIFRAKKHNSLKTILHVKIYL